MVGMIEVQTRQMYEKNPLITVLSYIAALVAPHGLTTRATYTLPVGRKALCTNVTLEAIRDVVATATALIRTGLSIIAGNPFVPNSMVEPTATGVVGNNVRTSVGWNSYLIVAGQTFLLVTGDASTGGSMTYRLGATVIEFDA